MIDRAARTLAADLTRRFRDGLITNDDLEEQWPAAPGDRALRAVATMLWRYYDDHRVETLKRPDEWTTRELGRYAAFLDSDLPYEWSEDRCDTVDWLRIWNGMTVGLIPGLSAMIRARDQAEQQRRAAEGDIDAWPFLRLSDAPEGKGRDRS